MAEEATTTPAPAETKETNGDAKPKRDFKKEQKPIEELYDLSQPIPRVSKCTTRPKMTYWNGRRNLQQKRFESLLYECLRNERHYRE